MTGARVDVDRQPEACCAQMLVPGTSRQLKAEVLSASMERSPITPPKSSTTRICRIGNRAANNRADAWAFDGPGPSDPCRDNAGPLPQ